MTAERKKRQPPLANSPPKLERQSTRLGKRKEQVDTDSYSPAKRDTKGNKGGPGRGKTVTLNSTEPFIERDHKKEQANSTADHPTTTAGMATHRGFTTHHHPAGIHPGRNQATTLFL